MTAIKGMFFRSLAMLMIISIEKCCGSDSPKSYGPSISADNGYQNSYNPEIQRPLAVFTERPINVAGFVLIPIVQVPSSDLRMIYRPQIDSVSKTEPIVMCKSSTTSVEATPAVQVPLQHPFYLYDERTMIPFPKTITILHGGYRVSIPVGVVVAPIPAGALKAGPVFVTTLFAIPASPLPVPTQTPVRFVPLSPYPPNLAPYLAAPPSPPQYFAAPPSPPPQYHAAPQPPSPQYSIPATYPSSQYSPSATHPSPPPPPYSGAAANPPSQYPGPAAAHLSSQYPRHPSSPTHYPGPAAQGPTQESQYSQPVPAAPAYYQHSGYSEDGDNDLRYQDPPGKLYSHYTASSPFYNSKESPVLNQLREESEKNRQKYASQPPPYSHHYQTVDA